MIQEDDGEIEIPMLEEDDDEEYSPFSKDEELVYEPEEFLQRYAFKNYDLQNNYTDNNENDNIQSNSSYIGSNNFVNEVIKKESGGNPNAVSNKGAIGKMQIMESALKDYNQVHKTKYTKNDLFNGELNEHIGSWYLQKRIPGMLNKFGIPVNRETVLASYNGGIGRTVNHFRKGAAYPKETQNYIKQVGGYSLLGSEIAKHKDEIINNNNYNNFQDTIEGAVDIGTGIYNTVKDIGSNLATGLSNAIDSTEMVTSDIEQRTQNRKILQKLYEEEDYNPIVTNKNALTSYLY